MSETMPTPNLNKALSQLQGELPRVTKTKTGKVEGENKAGKYFSYEYSYADLGDVVADVGPLLAKHGLAFHCGPTINPADRREMILLWSLLHESGEEKAGEWPLGPVNQKPQSLGSAITYGRRYCFTAATNIVLEDDDDGQRAQQDHGSRQSAGDLWDKSTPARPGRGNPDTNGQAAPPAGGKDETDGQRTGEDRRWADFAIEQAAGFKTEAEGQKLWRESATAVIDGRCTPGEATHIQNIINARVADRRREAMERLLLHLSETDEWREKVRDLADDDEACEAIAELGRLKAAGTINEMRAGRIAAAVIARFPKAAVKTGTGDG